MYTYQYNHFPLQTTLTGHYPQEGEWINIKTREVDDRKIERDHKKQYMIERRRVKRRDHCIELPLKLMGDVIYQDIAQENEILKLTKTM